MSCDSSRQSNSRGGDGEMWGNIKVCDDVTGQP